ncbi:Putative aminotransferase class V domain, kynureninase, pyridoxal phosphate-dependent transferase [Colletotrichum destructivum]|uniref:Kynureninase n=1 Tax=Colletotrichum destructivum TaxID=34406 RepID=A0AAX4HWP6_9PEZI|nr:Putative aminotransferase class V domain, kynureninase, pyridoxal phosphate-dependent transferase [Colletotrichum destructivum]
MDPPSRAHAESLDQKDALRHTRDEFVIPTKQDITSKTLAKKDESSTASSAGQQEKCTYLCGNSLGLQPKRTAVRIQQYLSTWATQGVQGHFKPLEDSPLPTWLDVDAKAAEMMAPIVGAQVAEVAVMQTLTANLHLLMSAFYKPQEGGRHKIILESKAFPSDHFAVETQIRHHGLSPSKSMICIEPPSASQGPTLTTQHILSTIEHHASDTALLLLPGIQYYTGQLLDIPTITAFAHKHSILVIWDLAHAVGNVPLKLHEWDVDAAAWCTYKYINGGPGCIGGAFVNSRHTTVTTSVEDPNSETGYMNRLAGWWGNDKSSRFVMATKFHPAPGAAGFQLSNPSVLDTTALCASLEVFEAAGGIGPLREKSVRLTGYLEKLLEAMPEDEKALFRALTPRRPEERGAQLSLLLADGLLDGVMGYFEEVGVVIDERKPNVIRVAPAPLYNTFVDCFDFVEQFGKALRRARRSG